MQKFQIYFWFCGLPFLILVGQWRWTCEAQLGFLLSFQNILLLGVVSGNGGRQCYWYFTDDIKTQRCSMVPKGPIASKHQNLNSRSSFYHPISSSWCRNSFPCLRRYHLQVEASHKANGKNSVGAPCISPTSCLLAFCGVHMESRSEPSRVTLIQGGVEIGGQIPELSQFSVVQFQCTQHTESQRSTLDQSLALHSTGLGTNSPCYWPSFCLNSSPANSQISYLHPNQPKLSLLTWVLLTYYTDRLSLNPKMPQQPEKSSCIQGLCSKYVFTYDLHWYFL